MLRLEFYSPEKLKKEITFVVGRHLNLDRYRVFFFGSRVTGKGNERSDIDVGIEGSEEIPLGTMSKIREDIENLPILYKVEIVDFKRVSPDFHKVAKRKIEIL